MSEFRLCIPILLTGVQQHTDPNVQDTAHVGKFGFPVDDIAVK